MQTNVDPFGKGAPNLLAELIAAQRAGDPVLVIDIIGELRDRFGITVSFASDAPQTSTAGGPLVVDERRAAELLGLSPRTVWGLAAKGELKCVRLGARKLYSIATLREFIRRHEA